MGICEPVFDPSKEQCSSEVYSNNITSLSMSCPPIPPSPKHPVTLKLETTIKNYIITTLISQSSALIQLDTLQFCSQIGDQACVFTNSNFKILFIQTTKDTLDNWILNSEAQNKGANLINNVRIIWCLDDATWKCHCSKSGNSYTFELRNWANDAI
jgi:hypothetical protein